MDKKEKQRIATAKYRAKNKGRIRKFRKRRREKEYAWALKRRQDPKTWPKVVMANIRHRAKKQGLEFSITHKDIIIPEVCPVFKTPFVFGADGKTTKANPNAPSVDRVDNTKGYTKDNIRIISYRANILKKNATLEELRGLVRYMEEALDDRVL